MSKLYFKGGSDQEEAFEEAVASNWGQAWVMTKAEYKALQGVLNEQGK